VGNGGETPPEPAGGTTAPRSDEADARGSKEANREGATGGQTIVGMENKTSAENLRFQLRVEGDENAAKDPPSLGSFGAARERKTRD
jgi:hypothetical protein